MSGTTDHHCDLVISLDQTGHLSKIPCTWAPSNTPVTEAPRSPSNTPYGETFVNSISTVNSISAIEDGKSGSYSPVTERFPPLYHLPRRTTHNYECESKIHDGKETCHCEPSPMTTASRRHTMSEHADGRPVLSQGSHSWTMEDQRRLQHAKMIYHDERRPSSWEEM